MARVMPFKRTLPRVGHTVTVAVGQPLDLGHITCRCNQPGEQQTAGTQGLRRNNDALSSKGVLSSILPAETSTSRCMCPTSHPGAANEVTWGPVRSLCPLVGLSRQPLNASHN
jgi:hypothetical protein